jgi:alcohol dehydrogenase (cytochrome c)
MGIFGATLVHPAVRWRGRVALLAITGQIPDIGTTRVLGYLVPGSGQWLRPLIETRNPYAVIRNTDTTSADIQAGARLFRRRCAACHGPDGNGGAGGPPLTGRTFTHGASDWALYRTVRFGIPRTRMGPHPLSETELWDVVAFLRSIHSPDGGLPVPERDAAWSRFDAVPPAELAATREPAADWLTYSGSYGSTRHSALGRINRGNVHQLTLRWIHPLQGEPENVEASPIVRGGIMFLTDPPSRVLALDALTGEELWTFRREPSKAAGGNEFRAMPNRGVAILNDAVFVGTIDAHLIALSAETGALRWDVTVAPDPRRYAITAAPLAYADLVVTGIAQPNAVKAGRGFVAAYDAKTGQERWRFNAIPQPGEHGNDTWEGDSWREGGAPTWLTGSYDPARDLLIWGVGSPKPNFDDRGREGDNLHSNSAVALRGSTGKLVWYFQFTPADNHDWDANQIPILADRETAQGTEELVLWANRNGFYYVLDRVSGRYLTAVPFARQTWTDGLDPSGRPRPAPQVSADGAGVILYPGSVGATNWWSPTYDPALQLTLVPVLEQGMVYFPSGVPQTLGRPFYTAIRALDAFTGRQVWEYRRPARQVGNASGGNVMGGLLSTRGGVVFGGDEHSFFALDSRSGRLLWSVETGSTIGAAPVTFLVDGEQFVTIAAGRNLLTFALPKSGPPASAP